jgi:hypothetical protein
MDVTVTKNQATNDGLDALIAGGSLVGKIGWTGADIHTNPETGATQQIATTALLNEFGYITTTPQGNAALVPARPFLRNTISRESRNWLNDIMRGGELVLDTKIAFSAVLEGVTATAVTNVRTTIRSRVAPPLAPLTLRKRLENSIRRAGGGISRGTTPLLDTGHMLNSLTNEVIST